MCYNCNEMELHADNIWTYIKGEHPKALFDSVTSYLTSGYWFADSFKKGHWDGRKRFVEFDRSRKQYRFASGFLDRVCRALDDDGRHYVLRDNRTTESAEPCYTLLDARGLPSVDLRSGKYSYQASVLDSVINVGRGIIHVATGGGKTEIGAAIIKSVNDVTAWMTHRKVLLYQTHKRLSERLGEDVGIIGDGICDIRRVTVCMVQSVERKKPEVVEFLKSVKLLIGDEIHHLESDQWMDVFAMIPASWRIGLTATPSLEGPGLALVGMTGEIIHTVSVGELIERKVLVPPRIWFTQCKEPQLAKKLAYQAAYKAGITENAHRHKLLRDIAWTFKEEEKSCLTLVKRINHGEILADYFSHHGVRCDFVQGRLGQSEREDILGRLSDGDLDNVVAISSILGEGADIPWLRAIINATGTRGGGNALEDDTGRETIQILGRGLRSSPGKEYLDYVDVSDTTHKSLTTAALDRVQTLESQGYAEFIKYWHDYVPTGGAFANRSSDHSVH